MLGPRSWLLCALLTVGVQGQSTSSASSATQSSAAASSVTSQASSSASPTRASATFTGFPTQSAAAYDNATASSLAKYLPAYTYNLTQETLATRIGICNQTTQFCASAKCTAFQANVTVNFCNEQTMGWNCECNNGAQSRLQPLAVPVNTYDCRLRTQACLQACENTRSSYRTNSTENCRTACNYDIGATCGRSNQFVPFYQVKNYNDKPKYYPDTSMGGVAAGITTSGATIRANVTPFAILGSSILSLMAGLALIAA